MRHTLSFAALLLLASPAFASPAFEIGSQSGSTLEHNQAVTLTPGAVTAILAGADATLEEVSVEEVQARAAARGVNLPVDSDVSAGPNRPWFILKAEIGMPAMLGADIEIYITPNFTIEAGTAGNLGATVYLGAIHWRPDFACFHCTSKNSFSAGLGLDVDTMVGVQATDLLIAAEADLQYIHHILPHFGWVAGLKLGAGPQVRVSRNYTPSPGEGAFTPGITLSLYTGLAF